MNSRLPAASSPVPTGRPRKSVPFGPANMGARYFCATVGPVNEKMVMRYIESQKWDQDDERFRSAQRALSRLSAGAASGGLSRKPTSFNDSRY